MSPSENNNALAVGIDFGGTTVKFGVVSGSKVIDSAPAIATDDYTESAPLIDAIVRVIEDLRGRHPEISAIGAGVPGFVDTMRDGGISRDAIRALLTENPRRILTPA